jgi:hypothetical protein
MLTKFHGIVNYILYIINYINTTYSAPLVEVVWSAQYRAFVHQGVSKWLF